MKTSIFPTATAVVGLMSAPAFADVTGPQVWGDMKDYMETFGYAVSAEENVDGDTLSIANIALSMTMPEGVMTVTMPAMELTDLGNGSVSVSLPPQLPIVFAASIEGEDVTGTINYDTEGLIMTVSGDPDNMIYTYAANTAAVSLSELNIGGDPMPAGMIQTKVTMNSVAGTSVMSVGNIRTITQNMTVAGMDYDVNIAPPGEGRVILKGGLDDLSFAGTTSIPSMMDPENMQTALANGFGVDARFDHKGGQGEFLFQDDNENVSGSTSSTGGSFGVVMNEKTLNYRIGGVGTEFSVQGGDIPFPVSMQMAESLFDLAVPISKGETPQDFALRVTLGKFQMSDIIWSIFDSQSILPHDPATISFDVTGTVNMLVDLLDPAQMAEVESGQAIPALPDSVSINNLLVEAAGAKLAGEGAFSFDNDDMQTFAGMPRPQGEVNLSLNGANGLMDKLVQMGLLPEEQAMGARMMMGMFAVPGEGEDALRSKIEINEQGHVLANGQRLR